MPGAHYCKHCGIRFSPNKQQLNRGHGKFCSLSCPTTYRNLTNNPSKRPEVRAKIKEHRADVSGTNNPMYGKNGKDAPGYIDGRSNFGSDTYRDIALANNPHVCKICGAEPRGRQLNVHHKDENRKNSAPENLEILCVTCHNNIVHAKIKDDKGRFMKKEVMPNV